MVDPDLVVALGFAAVCRAVMLTVAIVLLWLRPRNVAKRLLAIGLMLPAVIGVLDVGFILGFPGGQRVWFFFPGIVADVSALFLLMFLATYPTPLRWRSVEGGVFAVALAYETVAPFVETIQFVQGGDYASAWIGFYSPAYGFASAACILLALRRVGSIPLEERASAQRIIASLAVLAFVFAGYGIVANSLKLAGIPHHQRYGAGNTPVSLDLPFFVSTIVLQIGLSAYIYFRHRERLVLYVAVIGALAVGLDQLSEYNIINFGVFNLVTPLVALHAATRSGAFGVKKVPARVGTLMSVLAGFSVSILVAAVFTLAAGSQPFFLMLGSFAGLLLGALVAYLLRPRGLGIAIYRHPEEDAPARALTGTRVAPGALLAGRYRVDRVLGEGGEGHAFLARDEVLARDVVLKTVESGGQAAVREARLVAMLEHPNVVRVYDVLETASETVLVLEFADGGSLRGLLERRGPLPRAEAGDLLAQILAGLEAAHAAGIVHGDVKPENVLLGSDGHAKLADFGSARAAAAAAPNATVQQGGAGTVAYMSPEQARGQAPTERSDLYAAALCYHEMLTGAPVHDTRGLDALQARLLIANVDPIVRATEPEVARFLQKALAREPGARFASAAEMRRALSELAILPPRT